MIFLLTEKGHKYLEALESRVTDSISLRSHDRLDILSAISNRGMDYADLEDELGFSRRTLNDTIDDLKGRGYIRSSES